MIRPWQTWVLFGLCCAVVLAAMGWTSLTVLKLARAKEEANRRGEIEGRVRLALWRMDSALAPVIAQESARPYFAYTAFHPTELAYTHLWEEIQRGGVMVPSRLLDYASPYILVHFQVSPSGRFSSPQVPAGNMRDLAESRRLTTGEKIERAAERLSQLQEVMSRDTLLVEMKPPEIPETQPAIQVAMAGGEDSLQRQEGLVPQEVQQLQPQPPGQPEAQLAAPTVQTGDQADQQADVNAQAPRIDRQKRAMRQAEQITIKQGKGLQQVDVRQALLNDNEFLARSWNYETNSLVMSNPGSNLSLSGSHVREGLTRPIWIGDELILTRWVSANGGNFVQGCWLDWSAVREWLVSEVEDLLPNVRLEPVRETKTADKGRMLAGVPVMLVPGEVPVDVGRSASPIRISLLVAWACVLVAAAAVAVLLVGTVSLSERRAAFVSAVTHEMRTPLTTFRMYTEMLLKGMVPDEAKRLRYLDTLRVEADRLSHLVSNVLAYARLERNRTADRAETLPLASLIDRVRDRLNERVERASMTLVVDASESASSVNVQADASAVEQILFNLVDNACKYAASATDRRIHIEADCCDRRVILRVRDHGPGIAQPDTRRLFKPFCKSARDAANSAPGVGLGLALSRRLARHMRGRLDLDQETPDGVCFVLTLPAG